MWYPDQIEEAINNLAIEIDKFYYNGGHVILGCSTKLFRTANNNMNCSSTYHDIFRCEACKSGICLNK